MSLDFSLHRRKRSFPFPIFGLAATLGLAVLIFVFLSDGNDIRELFSYTADSPLNEGVGYTLMLSGFLVYMLGLGVISDINADFKILLHISRLAVFIFTFLSGYFIDSGNLPYFLNGAIISVIFNNVLLIIFFFYQKRTSSSYGSRIMMAVTTLQLLPACFITYRIFTAEAMIFIGSDVLFDIIAKIAFFILVYISIAANSIYILYINRKVR